MQLGDFGTFLFLAGVAVVMFFAVTFLLFLLVIILPDFIDQLRATLKYGWRE